MKAYVSNELYHHGILGMHWGIRRYQPYGQGYSPKSEGREVGEAAKVESRADRIAARAKKKADRVEKKAQKYRDREYKIAEKRYDYNIKKLEKKASKATSNVKKYAQELKDKGIKVVSGEENKREHTKLLTKVQKEWAAQRDLGREKANKIFELDAIKNMTPKDIKEEKKKVASAAAKQAILNFTLGPIGTAIGYSKYYPDKVKTKNRKALVQEQYKANHARAIASGLYD